MSSFGLNWPTSVGRVDARAVWRAMEIQCLRPDVNFQQRIKKGGGEEQIRRAMAAANATENTVTKKWGQVLLDKLARC